MTFHPSVAPPENKDIFLCNHNIIITPKEIISPYHLIFSSFSNFPLMTFLFLIQDQVKVLVWLVFLRSLSRPPLPPVLVFVYLFVFFVNDFWNMWTNCLLAVPHSGFFCFLLVIFNVFLHPLYFMPMSSRSGAWFDSGKTFLARTLHGWSCVLHILSL